MPHDLTNTEGNEGRGYYQQPIRVVKAATLDEDRSIDVNMMRKLMREYRKQALDYAESLRRREISVDNIKALT